MLGQSFLRGQVQRQPDLGSQATLDPQFPECHLQESPVPGQGLAYKSRTRARQAMDKEAVRMEQVRREASKPRRTGAQMASDLPETPRSGAETEPPMLGLLEALRIH